MVTDIEEYFRSLRRNLKNKKEVDDVSIQKGNRKNSLNIEKREYNVYISEDYKHKIPEIAKDFESNLFVETEIINESKETRYNMENNDYNTGDIIVRKVYTSAS